MIGEDIAEVMGEIYSKAKKPIVVIITGGEFTEKLERRLEDKGIPCFVYPESAARALRAFWEWSSKRHSLP